MTTRREALRALACLPLAARAAFAGDGDPAPDKGGRGIACALGEDADASLLPPPRRDGEHLALALAGTPKPEAGELARITGSPSPTWIELSPADRASVDDLRFAEQIRTAASVSLIEGSVFDWLVTLWPARRRSAVLGALGECAYTGGRVIGRGSTAFLVAGGGVARGPTRDEPGESRVSLANPREAGEARLTHGLQLCGEFVLDTTARSGGSLLRLISTLSESHLDEGVHLGARSALCGDLEKKSWSVLGEDPALHVDLRGSRRESRFIEGAFLSTLARGDGWSRRARGLFSAGEPADFASAADEVGVDDALFAARLVAPPRERAAWRDARTSAVLRRGPDARAVAGPGGGAVRGLRLALDVVLARGRFGELGP